MWQATAQDGKFTNGKCESAKMMTNAYLMQVINDTSQPNRCHT